MNDSAKACCGVGSERSVVAESVPHVLGWLAMIFLSAWACGIENLDALFAFVRGEKIVNPQEISFLRFAILFFSIAAGLALTLKKSHQSSSRPMQCDVSAGIGATSSAQSPS